MARPAALFSRATQHPRPVSALVGTGKLSDDLTARTRIEVGNTSSGDQSLDLNAEGTDQSTFNIRQMDIRLSSKSMGAFTIGDFQPRN